jgi:hypothetical protein
MNYDFIKEEFIKKHLVIDNDIYLDKYISFLINYKIKENVEYTEKHHILPRCTFPKYENEKWNIVEIEYEDHKLSHLLLFKAINIRHYQRPLNWMMNYYKNTEEISKAAKKGWENLKNDDIKYNNWKIKRSNYMKNLSSDEQRRRCNYFWENITDDEYLEFCSKMKNYWTEEKRIEKSNNMKEYYSNPNNKIRKSVESKNRWNSVSVEYRETFRNKMTKINKEENKRKVAGDKIKELWKDSEYLTKMKNRRKKQGVKLKLINTSGEEIVFDDMKSFINEYNFSAHLIRKYRDTKNKISEKDLNEKNITLLNCIIETIKN